MSFEFIAYPSNAALFPAGLSALLNEINKMEKKEIGTKVFSDYKDRFQLFITITLILLLIDLILLEKKGVKYLNFYKKQ